MTEPTRDELTRRIEQLERANRRWRRGSFVVAGLLAIGLVVLMAENYRQAMNARQQAELARQQAERVRSMSSMAKAALPNFDEIEKRHQEWMRILESEPTPSKLSDGLWPVRPVSQPHSKLPRPPWNLYDGAKISP
jgi:type VI protein secretion system component VasK